MKYWPRASKFQSWGRSYRLRKCPSLDCAIGLSGRIGILKWIGRLNKRDRMKIASRTKLQSESDLWKLYRRHLVTASSIFGIWRTIVNEGNMSKLCQRIGKYASGNLSRLPAIKYGSEMEVKGVREYMKIQRRKGLKLICERRGLEIWDKNPIFACSPDRIVTINEEKILLEVKCPIRLANKGVDDISLEYLIKNGEEYTLKRNHAYFGQVQMSLKILDLKKAHFFVYSPIKSLLLEIDFDEKFCMSIVKDVEKFYFSTYYNSIK